MPTSLVKPSCGCRRSSASSLRNRERSRASAILPTMERCWTPSPTSSQCAHPLNAWEQPPNSMVREMRCAAWDWSMLHCLMRLQVSCCHSVARAAAVRGRKRAARVPRQRCQFPRTRRLLAHARHSPTATARFPIPIRQPLARTIQVGTRPWRACGSAPRPIKRPPASWRSLSASLHRNDPSGRVPQSGS